MTDMPLSQWLERLEKLHPSEIELGLERVRTVASRMGLLPLPAPSIAVAGTNGKGTTVAALEALAFAAGERTGACTSPHFLRFNERIRVDGEEATDAAIVAAFETIESARGDISLTYFEFGVLAALEVFRCADVSLYLLEVGLGGRLDAVNIVDADVAIITSIALDHQDWLGDDLGQIGVEKAGIARRDCPVVVAEPLPPGPMLQSLAEIGARPVLLGQDFFWSGDTGQAWNVGLVGGADYQQLAPTALHPGNLAAALQALELLDCPASEGAARKLLATLTVRGRRQHLNVGQRDYLLDVAHNPAALEGLMAYLARHPVAGKTLALFSVMSDKDVHAMIALAGEGFDAWFVADIPGVDRAAEADALGQALKGAGVNRITTSRNPREALCRAESVMLAGDRLVIFGSFHTVAQVLPELEKHLLPHHTKEPTDDHSKIEP